MKRVKAKKKDLDQPTAKTVILSRFIKYFFVGLISILAYHGVETGLFKDIIQNENIDNLVLILVSLYTIFQEYRHSSHGGKMFIKVKDN